jgi:hypothetical protein
MKWIGYALSFFSGVLAMAVGGWLASLAVILGITGSALITAGLARDA